MPERRRPVSYEHEETEETIAAFDREREEAHELGRRHDEIVNSSRRNDRVVGRDRSNQDR